MAYKYRAYTPDKKVVQGTIEVASESLAEGALYNAGYQRILSLEEIRPGISVKSLIPTLFGVKSQDVIDFSNQMATLVESGVPILTSLQLLKGQASKSSLKDVLDGLVKEIQLGNPFSQALSDHPQVFSNTYCQVIRASEQAGNLEFGLRQAASYMEKQAATAQKIKRAMFYPAFVLLMAIGVSIMLVMVALPPLVNLFTSLGVELPQMTQMLISITDFAFDNMLYIIVGLLLVILVSISLLRLPPVKLARDRLILKIPLIGIINIERGVQQFCQIAAMLLKAGLHLPQIMDIAIQTNKNRIIRQSLSDVKDKLVQGEGLAQPLAEVEIFPPLLAEMAVVGEKTGTMDSTLTTLADYYEQRVDRRIEVLTSMIEPVLTLIIGIVVIFIALSMITPLYSIVRSMH